MLLRAAIPLEAFTYTGTFPCASTPTGTACTVGKFDLCWLFGKEAMFDLS